ncbi:uncharacterized protein Bfra_001387 [Botrytis fragariae]|uniref:Uncharacterized protein n=1 Tax=Botrytis fragariae TaxID=1964551 RepID=A0A8H6B088_9HELO|nr:uncharacterized protein Bfra_001387 [Botrytis fragariae]KAF5877028.1 hypothetical protein Bfra_001387 [Botrytis fragariae]
MECNIGSVTNFYLNMTPELFVRGEARKKIADLMVPFNLNRTSMSIIWSTKRFFFFFLDINEG